MANKKVKQSETILKLKVLAKKKEGVRRDLVVTAQEKENVRGELVVTAEKLRLKAKQLAVTAKKKEVAIKYTRSLIEASLDPLITISSEGKITDVNEATVKVTGVSYKKLIGTDFSDYFTEPEKALEVYKRVFREGSVTDYPLTVRSQEGGLTDVLYNASVYKDDKGNVLGVVATARDVTETKKANELMETVRRELAVTAEELKVKAENLATTAEEKEDVRQKLAVTAKQLAVTAKEKESVRHELAMTAEELKVKAENLATTAEEKEDVRRELLLTAKEKESVRRELAVTAEELKVKAENLATTAEEKESVRLELAVTAKQLAVTAKEKEDVRRELLLTAKEKDDVRRELLLTAKEKENVRHELAVTAEELKVKAENLATTAQEKESVRLELAVTAKQLAVTAKQLAATAQEKESVRLELAETAKDLARTKARDEAMLESIGDGVFALDSSGKIILFNAASSKITGLTASEVIGQPFQQVLKFEQEKNNTPNNNFIKLALAGKRAQMIGNTAVVKKNGVKIPVADSAAPILDNTGNVIGAVVVFRDVTAEREIDRMKDEFVTITSHELRTPMTAIAGFVDMLREGRYGKIAKEIDEPLSYIAQSTKRLTNLVSDMLDVSRSEAGRLKFNIVDLDLRSLLQDVLSSLQPVSVQKGVGFKLASNTSVKVKADPEKTKQVLINLIGNSLKFTDKGVINISTELKDNLVQIMVHDTGIGISKEDQPKLFGKFVQISSQQAGKPVGTGLGLYLSRELARKMGGDLWLESSEKDSGSTFILSLPKAS